MSFEQIITLVVLAGVIAALIHDKIRADIVALAGAAVLLASGAVRPSEVQSAFGSPALITLASLFVIAHAMELSGLLDRLIRAIVRPAKNRSDRYLGNDRAMWCRFGIPQQHADCGYGGSRR